MRFWIRSLAVGAAAGLVVGLVIGGTLGRVFMRMLTLAREDSRGFETAMGAIIGDFTAGGTGFVYFFAAGLGSLVGLGYVLVRVVLPKRWRLALFTLAITGLLVGVILNSNRDDFLLVPVTLSILLVVGSVALTALPVPLLVERFAPDRERNPGRVVLTGVGVGVAAVTVYASLAIASAYAV
jgi:hypothetical protein